MQRQKVQERRDFNCLLTEVSLFWTILVNSVCNVITQKFSKER